MESPLVLEMLLLLLLSRFSRVRLCATPQTAAHQAPLSLGFSRQEHWSGLPFPSPMHAYMLSHFSRVQLCLTRERWLMPCYALSTPCFTSQQPDTVAIVFPVGEGNGNPLQYSCLENPVDRGAWWAAVCGVAQSRTRLKLLSMHACIGEGNGNPLQYSCLENHRDRGAWWATVYGVAESDTTEVT